jgi:hypothetical protein
MKKISVLLFLSLLLVMIGSVSCNDSDGAVDVETAPAPVPQTGQTTCWDSAGNVIDCAGTGQDGDIRAGVEWPAPRFTDNGDGTIRDNLTGLIWLKDALCLGLSGIPWQQALDFANGLADGECGLTDGSVAGDWYLPNRNELKSLLDLENFNPTVPTGNPFINFESLPDWSSTTKADNTDFAWAVQFGAGVVVGFGTASTNFPLPVHGGSRVDGETAPAPVPQTGQTTCWDSAGNVIDCAGTGQDGDIRAGVEWPAPRFTDNGDGTIRDNLTGLIWLKDALCLGLSGIPWQQALDFANGLADGECGLTDGSVAGDWYLPNRNELESLLDLENFNPTVPTGNPFINFESSFYWSSTTQADFPEFAWGLNFGSASVISDDKADFNFVTAVRGGS